MSCSTADVPAPRAFAYWRDRICDTFVQLSATPTGDGPFRGELHSVDHGGVHVTTVRAGGQRVRRTRQLIARSSDAHLLASIQVAGRGRVEQDGRVAELTPGAMSFYDSTRPYTLHFDDAFEQIVVQLPRERLLSASGARDEASALTAVPLAAGGPGTVIAGFFSSLAVLQRRDPDGARLLSVHADRLLASALQLASGDQRGDDDRELTRQRVLQYLRRHALDPALDADAVAAACHLSRRALFRLFEGELVGLGETLRRIRVDDAARMLVAFPQRPVASIGAACGFAGEAQFHRAFRALTGRTPAEHRAAGTGGQ